MAGRIRSIKPEILEDEKAASLSDAAWRLWVSMWLIADDYGNLRGDSRRLAADIWWAAETPPDVSELLLELESKGFAERYEVRGQKYVAIGNWKKHQRIDNAGKARVPGPAEDDIRGNPPRDSEIRGSDLRPPTSDQDHDHRSPALVVSDEWRELTGNLVSNPSSMLDVVALVEQAAEADETTVADAAKRYIAAFVAWVANCPAARRPQKAPHKFVDNFAAVQEWARGERKADDFAPPADLRKPIVPTAPLTVGGEMAIDD